MSRNDLTPDAQTMNRDLSYRNLEGENSADEVVVDTGENVTSPSSPVPTGGIKSKIMATTEKYGMSQNGSFKGLVWGLGLGIAGVLFFQWLKREGYIKIGN